VSGGYKVEELTQADRAGCDAVLDAAFAATLKHFLGKVPPGRMEGTRITNRCLREGSRIFGIRDDDRVVRAVLHLQRAGTRSIAGPLSVDRAWQMPWKSGVAEACLDALARRAVEEGGGIIDSVTFPHSTTHFDIYWKYGIPVFQAVFFSRAPAPNGQRLGPAGIEVARFSALSPDERQKALAQCREVTAAYWEGFDHSADIQHATAQKIGDTLLVHDGGRIVGFAIFHAGPGGEGFFDEQLLIKHLYVHPGAPNPKGAFHALFDEIERIAVSSGSVDVSAMASTGRRATIEALRSRGYRATQMHTQMFWMPAASAAEAQAVAFASFKADQLALAEWR
jgi:hypothetical protein